MECYCPGETTEFPDSRLKVTVASLDCTLLLGGVAHIARSCFITSQNSTRVGAHYTKAYLQGLAGSYRTSADAENRRLKAQSVNAATSWYFHRLINFIHQGMHAQHSPDNVIASDPATHVNRPEEILCNGADKACKRRQTTWGIDTICAHKPQLHKLLFCTIQAYNTQR